MFKCSEIRGHKVMGRHEKRRETNRTHSISLTDMYVYFNITQNYTYFL